MPLKEPSVHLEQGGILSDGANRTTNNHGQEEDRYGVLNRTRQRSLVPSPLHSPPCSGGPRLSFWHTDLVSKTSKLFAYLDFKISVVAKEMINKVDFWSSMCPKTQAFPTTVAPA